MLQYLSRLLQKLTVPVIADTFLSVGGTISTGGFGVTTYNLGLQVDHVQELEVVTGDGQILTCSDPATAISSTPCSGVSVNAVLSLKS